MFLFNIFIHSLNKNILLDFSFYHFGGNTRSYCDEIVVKKWWISREILQKRRL